MKKWYLAVAAMLIAGTTFAQTTFGLRVGPNFSSATQKVDGEKETSKIITGVAGGAYANIPIATDFYIQPALQYEGKGGKAKDFDVTTRLNYLTLPIDFVYKPEMGDGSNWIVGVGPYLGYGLGGKVKGGDETTSDQDPFDSEFGLKRFDAGANVQVGYEFNNGFNIGLNTELGLLNLVQDGDNDNSFRNTSFGVSVGYTFRR
ncbi:porin family protein [Compostibacter hankyongensis]